MAGMLPPLFKGYMMVNMSMPSICVEVVNNGYIVQWKRKLTDNEIAANKTSDKSVWLTKVAKTHKEFIVIIDEAGKQIKDMGLI